MNFNNLKLVNSCEQDSAGIHQAADKHSYNDVI